MAKARSVWVRRLRAGALVGVAVGVVAAVVAFTRPLFFERAEFWTYDQRARAAATTSEASPAIVIVDIDEQSIEDAENNMDVSWPWPRAMFGYITAYAAKAEARAVVFDWLFQDRGQFSVNDAEEFAQAMRDAGNVIIGLSLTRTELVQRKAEGRWAASLRTFRTRAEAERAALELMAWNTRCFLVGDGPTELLYGGVTTQEHVEAAWRRMSGAEEISDLFVPEGAEEAPPPAPRQLTAAEPAGELTAASIIARRDSMELESGGLDVMRMAAMDPPLAVIAAAPARTGNVYQDNEADGILRRYSPLASHEERLYPSLALAAYLVGHPEVEPRLERGSLVLDGKRVPLDRDGRFAIRYHGKTPYERVKAYDILRSYSQIEEGAAPAVPLEALRGKYVIVSASGHGLRDLRVTPVSRVHQGADVHATALDNLENGAAIRRLSPTGDALLAFLVCLLLATGMVAVWTLAQRPAIALLATGGATALLLVGYWAAAGWLYDAHGLWIAVGTPAIGGVLSAFAALLVTSATERRGRRFVQEALGRYTSSALVDALMEHPEYLSLEWGEKREMSVYFSDIAGFTTISEDLSPEALVALLNDYLTNMTDIVLEHGGIVDKYIGDAVMAFWGAPLPDADHARKAVRCAIAMRKRCDELRAGWKERFSIEIFARAGVNSGTAVVGNMGSKHKYNYTAMGDMVNLASRLEGANKPYGTHLMISEHTYARVEDEVEARELDLLAVKGKDEPVVVYELLGPKGEVERATMAAVECFREGLACYRARAFEAAIEAFERALESRPEDGPSTAYIDRCQHFLEAPPPDDWDGVWRMKEK